MKKAILEKLNAIKEKITGKSTETISWQSKMTRKYGKDIEQELKYWDGIMLEEMKKHRNHSYTEIDSMTQRLLDLGYRIVKSSAITPKGKYNIHNTAPYKEEAAADNLFFEQKFNQEEFEALYNRFGRYENNFPDYFSNKDAFKNYVDTHDIWVLENIKTGDPVGFSTFNIIEDKNERKYYNTKDNQILLYHDTLALDSEMQSKGVGIALTDIMDAYYLQYFETQQQKEINYALCTGEINTDHKNRLSKSFHEKRGFGKWIEGKAPLKKWIKRYNSMKHQSKPEAMLKSYLGINTYQ